MPRSWSPEDESHDAFKIMILESFEETTFQSLKHICHDLALKCIGWFATPEANNYSVVMLIIKGKY